MQPKFNDVNQKSYVGSEAEKRLSQKNDKGFFTKDGIIQVSEQRWKEAQAYEYDTWMNKARGVSSDRNEEHKKNFDDYKDLKPVRFSKVCELGCGPFTNLRLILPQTKYIPGRLVLVDPLIQDYLLHKNCSYKDKRLFGFPVECVSRKIEDFDPEVAFDLVVMINVLPHCMDAQRIFEKIDRLMGRGGMLIFHEVSFNLDPILQNKLYDSGHPLMVGRAIIDQFLKKYITIYEKRIPGKQEYLDQYIYFIGVKDELSSGISPKWK